MVAPSGACMVAPGGVHGCSGGVHGCLGACMLARGGHACLLPGSMCGCSRGACVVAQEGMCGCSGGHVWLLQGACMVAPGRGAVWDTSRYGDTINERAVCILLECILVL